MEIEEIRRDNLKFLVRKSGETQMRFAAKYEILPSYLSQLTTGRRNMGSRVARDLEAKMGLDSGWFDSPHWEVNQQSSAQYMETGGLPDPNSNSFRVYDAKVEAIARAPVELSPMEADLIQLFRGMPESEKTNIISELMIKKKEYDALLTELIKLRNSTSIDLLSVDAKTKKDKNDKNQ